MHNHFNGAKTALLFGAIMALFIVVAPRLQPDHSGVDVQETARQVLSMGAARRIWRASS